MKNAAISNIFGGGVYGVQYFFVISGFIITTLLLTEKIKTGHISLRHFYLRRLLRIFPLTYLFLLVLIIVSKYYHLGVKGSELLASFLFIKNFPVPGGWYTAHYWSLSVEEQYYLIFPFILSRGGVKVYLNVCILFIALFFGKNIVEHFSPAHENLYSVLDIFLSINFLAILIGSLCSILLFKYDAALPPMSNVLLTTLHALLFLVAFLAFRNPKFFGLSFLVSSCAIAAGIFLYIKFPYGVFHSFLNTKLIAYIGKLSFSLYIWQQLFTAHRPWKDSFKYGDSIILNLIFLGIVAYLSYNYFEKPFLKLKERFK
jgi:peptidoglycan/LPS O-acetylase OafA/YrhL